jgi:nicotinate-nucleotide adenylyltransferase
MRIGIFGGTFDPIHLAHMVIAEQAREQAKLDEIWFIPAARPPHKTAQPLTAFDKRADMIELAIAGNPAFRLERIESERTGPSYTADTLAELKQRHPQAELFLILGADCLPDLPTWHEPQRVVAQATLVLVARPGWSIWTEERIRASLNLSKEAPLSVQIVTVPQIDIASRDLRRRVAEGRSVRYMLPSGVLAYIQDKKLYAE